MRVKRIIIACIISVIVVITFIVFAEGKIAKLQKSGKVLDGDQEVLERKSIADKALSMFKCIPTREIRSEKREIIPLKKKR